MCCPSHIHMNSDISIPTKSPMNSPINHHMNSPIHVSVNCKTTQQAKTIKPRSATYIYIYICIYVYIGRERGS